MRKDMTTEMRRETTELCDEIREAVEGEEGTANEEATVRAWIAWRVASTLSDTFGAVSYVSLAPSKSESNKHSSVASDS
jgi:hypothetical protein